MIREKRFIFIIIVCLLLFLMILPAVDSCTETDKTGKTLKIGITTPTTGRVAEKGVPLAHANLDAVKYVNDELGGVNGYQIEIVWLDNSYDAEKVATIVQRFRDEGCLMFATSSSAMMNASMEIANQAGFPGLAAFSSPILYRPPMHIYGQLPDYGDDFLAFMEYYLDNIWEGSGVPRVALHLLDNSTGYGARDAARARAGTLGIEVVATEFHSDSEGFDLESLERIKAANPDVLYISSVPVPTALIIESARELDMFPEITIASGHAGFTKALLDTAGWNIVEGVYGVFPTASWGDDVSGMAKMTEYCWNLHPDDFGNMDYITAWAQSLIMAEILRVAIENVGYDALAAGNADSWAAVENEGIKKLKNYDIEGLHGPVNYVEGDNRLSKSVRVFQVQAGVIKAITGWIDAPVVEYEKYDWFGN